MNQTQISQGYSSRSLSHSNDRFPEDRDSGIAQRVCVLAGTTGATTALQRFFARLTPRADVAFVVTLRLGSETAFRLADLLQRNCALPVRVAADGMKLVHGEVAIVPADMEVSFSAQAGMELKPCRDGLCLTHPLDQVLKAVARCYRGNSGALMFSGIGDDGVAGCHSIERHGGEVWVQDPASAQYRHLPDMVNRACRVSFSANPEGLADRLVQELALLEKRSLRSAV